MAAPDRTTVFQKYYMLIYIEPLIVAIHMPKEWDSLRTGETLVRLFKFPRHVCECGHNKDYHLMEKQDVSSEFATVRVLDNVRFVKGGH